MDIRQGDRQILDIEGNPLDRIEDIEDRGGEAFKPLRNATANTLEKIPTGPLGKVGDGNVFAGTGYLAIKTGQLAVLPVPGIRQPGFHTISHGVRERDGFEEHNIRITAASKSVAEVAAEYEVASPSNIDYITSEVETVEVNELTSRSTYSTWEFIVEVADRGTSDQ